MYLLGNFQGIIKLKISLMVCFTDDLRFSGSVSSEKNIIHLNFQVKYLIRKIENKEQSSLFVALLTICPSPSLKLLSWMNFPIFPRALVALKMPWCGEMMGGKFSLEMKTKKKQSVLLYLYGSTGGRYRDQDPLFWHCGSCSIREIWHGSRYSALSQTLWWISYHTINFDVYVYLWNVYDSNLFYF